MKIKNKKTIAPLPETFTKIKANTLNPYEIRSVGGAEERVSDFLPIVNGEDTLLPDPELVAGPTGPAGPQGPPGEGISGGISGFVWDTTEPTSATNLEGVPQGTTFSIGTSSIDVLKSILYPSLLSFSQFDIGIDLGPYHVGATTQAGTYTSSWTINDVGNAIPNSIKIEKDNDFPPLIADYSLTSAADEDGNTADITHPAYVLSNEGNINFTVSLLSNDGNTITETQSIRWNYPMYAGKLSNDTISSGDLNSLSVDGTNPFISFSLNKMKSGITLDFPFGTGYLYWLVPKKINSADILGYPQYNGAISFSNVSNPNVPLPLTLEKISDLVLNTEFGDNITFEVFKSPFDFAGAISVLARQV